MSASVQPPRDFRPVGNRAGDWEDMALQSGPGRYPAAGALAAALADRVEEVCRDYLPGGARAGNYWQAGSVAGEKGRSLYVYLTGRYRGRWTDEATGEKGDLLDLIRAARGHARLIDAKDEAVAFLGNAPSRDRVVDATPARIDTSRLARFLRTARILGENSPAARYLKRRGLLPADALGLRYHPAAWVQVAGEMRELPALLAPVRIADGTLEAVHRIFLSPDGSPAEIDGHKRTLGSPGRGGVWFGDPESALRVAICEGVEDALAVLRVLTPEEKREIAVVASVSAGRVARVEFPNSVREAVLVQDRDAAGERAWEALKERYEGADVHVSRVLPVGKDANDDLLQHGVEGLRSALVPLTKGLLLPQLSPPDAERVSADARREMLAASLELIGASALALRLAGNPGEDDSRNVMEAALTGDARFDAIGSLRTLKVIGDDEWEYLAARSREEWLPDLGERSEEMQVERGVAWAYSLWSRERLEVDGRAGWLFVRIARLFETIGESVGNGSGR